jgi:SP family arabinose:H+ symporter-like MFS transporter
MQELESPREAVSLEHAGGRSEIDHRFVAFLSITAALGGLLFGFDISIITGAGPFFSEHFKLDELTQGLAYSSLLFGCIPGSVIAGRLTDLFGRRRVLLVVAVVFAITTVASGLAPTLAVLILARFLGGLAVGGISIVSPMYVAEVAPAKLRGRLCAFYQLSITVGILVSYLINYSLHDVGPWNWRWMFISGAIPSAVFVLMLLRAPETPRYLFKAGLRDQAFELLRRISGQAQARIEIAEIEGSLAASQGSWRDLLQPWLRRPLAVGFVLAILVHWSGINTFIDYAPKIFQSAGFKMDAALFSTFIIGFTNFLLTLVSFWVIDRYGRKPLYIVGSLGMTAVLLSLVVASLMDRFTGLVVLVLIMAFIAFFAACIGPVFWTLVPEIFPNRVRGTAMVVPVLTQWLANALAVQFFPFSFKEIGKAPTFGFLAVMAFLQVIFTWRFVPETKGKTLEEIEEMWNGGAKAEPARSIRA